MYPVSSHALLQRPAVLLPAAALLLVAAAGVIWADLAARNGHAVPVPARAVPPPSLLIAATDIDPGMVLTDRDVMLRTGGPAPPSALRRAEDATGHMALTAVKAGSPLLAAEISADQVQGIAPHVPPGLRAYAVPVTESQIAGGFLQAGDTVDVYVTLPGALFAGGTSRMSGDRSRSTLLLQNVPVLAAGTKLHTDGKADTGVRTVTLALPPADLARLALANRLGALSFAIRNPLDHAGVTAQPAALDTLAGNAAPRKSAPARNAIVLYSGRERRAVAVP